MKCQFRAASEEERGVLRRKLITLGRAEWYRRTGKKRDKKRKAFITSPFSFTKQLLGQKNSGNLTCPVEQINHHLNIIFSDPLREKELGPCESLIKLPEPVVQLQTAEPSLKEVQEAVMATRSSSSQAPVESPTESTNSTSNSLCASGRS